MESSQIQSPDIPADNPLQTGQSLNKPAKSITIISKISSDIRLIILSVLSLTIVILLVAAVIVTIRRPTKPTLNTPTTAPVNALSPTPSPSQLPSNLQPRFDQIDNLLNQPLPPQSPQIQSNISL